MTSEWPSTPNIQKYPVYNNYLLSCPKFWPVSLYDQSFLRYKVENAPNDLEQLTVKSTQYTIPTLEDKCLNT